MQPTNQSERKKKSSHTFQSLSFEKNYNLNETWTKKKLFLVRNKHEIRIKAWMHELELNKTTFLPKFTIALFFFIARLEANK